MPKIKEKAPAVCRPAGAETVLGKHPGQVKPNISRAKNQAEVLEGKTLTDLLKKEYIPRRLLSEELSNIYQTLGEEQLNRKETFCGEKRSLGLVRDYATREEVEAFEYVYFDDEDGSQFIEQVNAQGKEFRFDFMEHSRRCRECGTLLEFAYEDGNKDGKPKLYSANFCKDRLCPMCARRRSLKIFGQVSQVMDVIADDHLFLFLTLTVPNVTAEALSDTLNRLNLAFKTLLRYSAVKKVVNGFFRVLEVTYNTSRNDYHPHFHCILAVPKGYCSHGDYISRDKWLNMWRKAYKDDSITQVDIRVCRSKNVSEAEAEASDSLKSAVAEVSKYSAKVYKDGELFPADVIKTLALCLANRRLSVFDREKAFGTAFKKLKLEDAEAENADLVHLDEINPHVALTIVQLGWSSGAYKIMSSRRKEADDSERV